jgi:predicted RNA-binding protein
MTPAWEETFDEAQKKTEDTRRKMFIDSIREKIPAIDPDLAFLTPVEILDAMTNNPVILDYHRKLESYEAPEKELALLYPDADRKPWTNGKTDALIYRNLHTSIKNLKLADRVHIFTISPLLGVVPMEWYDEMPMYDASGSQSFMVRRRGLSWDQEIFRDVIQKSGELLESFLSRNHERMGTWHVIYRDPSVHKRIFETSMDIQPRSIWPHKTRKSLADSYLAIRNIMKEIVESL